jgi:hypothetical protein
MTREVNLDVNVGARRENIHQSSTSSV